MHWDFLQNVQGVSLMVLLLLCWCKKRLKWRSYVRNFWMLDTGYSEHLSFAFYEMT